MPAHRRHAELTDIAAGAFLTGLRHLAQHGCHLMGRDLIGGQCGDLRPGAEDVDLEDGLDLVGALHLAGRAQVGPVKLSQLA